MLKFPRLYMTIFQSQMPKMWGISCYKKKCSVQKARFKHSLVEKVTPSCCACSSGRKQMPSLMGWGWQRAAREGWPSSEIWVGEGGEHIAVFWKNMTTAVAESFQKRCLQSLIKDWYFYCSRREGVGSSFGDCWVAVCFLACSRGFVVLLFENGQRISAEHFCDLSRVILLAKMG